jgi:hypothetical protein
MKDAPSSEHYKNCSIEPITYIEANNLSFHAGNVVKYVSRYKHKNGIDDLLKARWYIDRLIAMEEGKNE